ncbi:Hypothetical predicted protein [Olea europaea subsp. europaea]|uniref:Uncharacterized protein n=1 Tax=Olea europaea subsp. europaea TaxID=158383 RepID=A0A8S0PJL5_OLEEU|nr:Hypothetical predicted protein [Olea europaea subsp. europaea]
MSNNYDNWERLVEVVLRREQLWQLALISSREPSFSSISGWSTPIRDDRNVQLGFSSSSTVHETDWERLLPPDYKDIISRSVNPVVYATKEDLFMSLCSSPILLDGGKMSFHIDKTTGKNCYMIGAMELGIDDRKFELEIDESYFEWKLTSQADSRFSMVGDLRFFLDADIRGKIETEMLSPKTHYAAYLVHRLEMSYMKLRPAKRIIMFVNLDEDHDAEKRGTALHLQPALVGKSLQTAVSRPDGWREV